MTDLPSPPTLKVLLEQTYLETVHRRVALRVVSDGAKNQLRFYKWRRANSESEWKVDLARFSITDIDLCRLVSDAIELARAFKIRLDWLSLEQLQGVGFSVQTLPECPRCHSDQVGATSNVTKWCCQQCEHEWESS
jgi:hypothetical protein